MGTRSHQVALRGCAWGPRLKPDSDRPGFRWPSVSTLHPPRSAVCDGLCRGGLVCLCWAPGSDPHGKGAHALSHQFRPPIHPPPSFFSSKLRPLPAELRLGSSLKQSLVKTADRADPMEAFRGKQSPVPSNAWALHHQVQTPKPAARRPDPQQGAETHSKECPSPLPQLVPLGPAAGPWTRATSSQLPCVAGLTWKELETRIPRAQLEL